MAVDLGSEGDWIEVWPAKPVVVCLLAMVFMLSDFLSSPLASVSVHSVQELPVNCKWDMGSRSEVHANADAIHPGLQQILRPCQQAVLQ